MSHCIKSSRLNSSGVDSIDVATTNVKSDHVNSCYVDAYGMATFDGPI